MLSCVTKPAPPVPSLFLLFLYPVHTPPRDIPVQLSVGTAAGHPRRQVYYFSHSPETASSTKLYF